MQGISEDDEETRKTAKQSSSRIPTFHSSLARKRPGNSAESTSPIRQEASGIPIQSKEKPSHAGEISKPKSFSGRESALPLPSVRLPGAISDAYAVGDHSDPVSSSPEVPELSFCRKGSPNPGIPEQLQRPSIRSDLGSGETDQPERLAEFTSEASCPDQDATSEDEEVASDADSEDQKVSQENLSSADEETPLALKEESFGLEECPEETFSLKQTECLIEGTVDHEKLISEECTTEEEKVNPVPIESVKTEQPLTEYSSPEKAQSSLDRNTELSKDSEALASKLPLCPDEVEEEMVESDLSSHQRTSSSSPSAKVNSMLVIHDSVIPGAQGGVSLC